MAVASASSVSLLLLLLLLQPTPQNSSAFTSSQEEEKSGGGRTHVGLNLLRADESRAKRGQTRTSWTQINGVNWRATGRRREEQLSEEAMTPPPPPKHTALHATQPPRFALASHLHLPLTLTPDHAGSWWTSLTHEDQNQQNQRSQKNQQNQQNQLHLFAIKDHICFSGSSELKAGPEPAGLVQELEFRIKVPVFGHVFLFESLFNQRYIKLT